MNDTVLAGVSERLLRYRSEHIEQVVGWFKADSAEVVATLLEHQVATEVPGGVAEIGVHHGKSFLLLANGARPGDRAVALDVFGMQDKNLDRSGLGDRGRFEQNASAFAPEADIEIVEMSSLEVTGDSARDVFGDVRLMSIDGGHTAAITAHDLALAEACVVEDGVIVLDDVLNAHWLGVVSGLFLFLDGGTGLVPFAYSDNKLYLARSADVAARYKQVLRDSHPDLLGKTGVEFHGEVIDVYGQGSPREAQANRARTAQAAAQQKRIAGLEAELGRARKRVEAVTTSRSWQVTAPLRLVSGRVGRRTHPTK